MNLLPCKGVHYSEGELRVSGHEERVVLMLTPEIITWLRDTVLPLAAQQNSGVRDPHNLAPRLVVGEARACKDDLRNSEHSGMDLTRILLAAQYKCAIEVAKSALIDITEEESSPGVVETVVRASVALQPCERKEHS